MNLRKTLLVLTIFSIAMGFMESAVVIYLRELYYPGGFKFPLIPIPPNIGLVEVLREAATLIMLITIGMIAGKNGVQRFCLFLFSFAIWDLFYYIFLKVFLDWPESLLTPDILFLIPVPWVGPVITPCIASATMIGLTIVITRFQELNVEVNLNRREWMLLVSGSLFMLTSFMYDYFTHIAHTTAVPAAQAEKIFGDFSNYVPKSFNWPLFSIGELLLLLAVGLIINRFSGIYRRQIAAP